MTIPAILIQLLSVVADSVTLVVNYAFNWSSIKAPDTNVVHAKQVDPSDPYSAWVRAGPEVQTSVDDCHTVDAMMRKIVNDYGDKPCIGMRKVLSLDPKGRKMLADKLTFLTYRELDHEIDSLVAGFREIGVKRGDRVAIFMETRYEWMAAAQAVLRMGANMATLYATLGNDGIVNSLNELETATIVSSNGLLPKLKSILAQCPGLTNLVLVRDQVGGVYTSTPTDLGDGVHVFLYDQLRQSAVPEADADPRHSLNQPSDIACVMYTSGSTGVPKGVQLSHTNIMSCLRAVNVVGQGYNLAADSSSIAILPLAHILEFCGELGMLSMGYRVCYGSPTTLTDGAVGLAEGCRGDFSVIQPQMAILVPLILDRMRKAVTDKVRASLGETGDQLFKFVLSHKAKWNNRGYGTPLIDRFILKGFRAILGGQPEVLLCGGAPLSAQTQIFAKSAFGVDVCQCWASTEMTCTGTIMNRNDFSVGRCGAPQTGVRIKLRDWSEGGYLATDKPNPRGELILGGPHIAVGYFKREAETEECFFDDEGTRWFISGDIAEIFPDGTVKIIDRRKDLVKLQNGEFISLGKIESELKGSPLVENICVVADPNQTSCVALVIPNKSALKRLVTKHNLPVGDDLYHPSVNDVALKEIVEYANQTKLRRLEIPKRIKLCKEEWTPSNNLVTAALKIKRKEIQKFYTKDIAELYA